MLIRQGTERGSITIPFSHKIVSLLFGYHKIFKPQLKTFYNSILAFSIKPQARQNSTSLLSKRKGNNLNNPQVLFKVTYSS